MGVCVDDILTGGENRGHPWRRRGLIAGAVIVAVGLVVLRHLPGDAHSAARHAQPAVVANEPVPRILHGRAVPGGASSPQLRLMSGVRVPLAGPRPYWFWPATGRAERIGALPVTGGGYTFTRVAGGWALTRSTFARPACYLCMRSPLPVYFLSDQASAARWAGNADAVAPAATAGWMWLTSYRAGEEPGTQVAVAREVGPNGRPLGPSVQLPDGYAIEAGTSRGLLLASVTPRSGVPAFMLWNPGAGQAGRPFVTVLAVSAQQIAWMPRCSLECTVNVTDVVTGRVIAVRQQAGEVALSAAFSPDGSYLAVQVGTRSPDVDMGMLTRLYVLSLRTGRVAPVPGTQVSDGTLVAFGWPAATDTLVAALSFPAKIQLAAWHPGAGRPGVVTLEPDHGAARLVLG